MSYFLPIELLHGVTFSLSRVATVDFVQAALPEAWLTTGQQILLVAGPQGIGGGLGALGGGWFMDAHGGNVYGMYMYGTEGVYVGGWFMHAHGGKLTYQCAAITD